MGLFGAIVRTAVNVVTLPVTLPVAVAKDALDYMEARPAENTEQLVQKIKDEADEEA